MSTTEELAAFGVGGMVIIAIVLFFLCWCHWCDTEDETPDIGLPTHQVLVHESSIPLEGLSFDLPVVHVYTAPQQEQQDSQ